MTQQEFFDKTVAHIRSLPERAFDHDAKVCSYLTPDGRKCAIGVHIPDGHPGQKIGGGVAELVYDYPDLAKHVLPEGEDGLGLAEELQNAHDAPSYWSSAGFVGEDVLQYIAELYGLTYTAP